MKKATYIQQITPTAYVAGTKDVRAIITERDKSVQYEIGTIRKEKKAEYMEWGANNTLPTEREVLIRSNNVVGELIATKRDLTLGQGLYAFRLNRKIDSATSKWRIEKEEVQIPEKAQAFFDRVDIHRENQIAAGELFMHDNVFTQFVMKKSGRVGTHEIESMMTKRCRHVRVGRQDKQGRIARYYWRGTWDRKHRSYNKEEYRDITSIPAYDATKDHQGTFMLHSYDPILFDDYYAHPRYWGANAWIRLANCIPDFHLSNLANGYNIRFHIEIPNGYFEDSTVSELNAEDKEIAVKKAEDARQAFMDTVNDFLAGIDNAGRALFTGYDYNQALGKEYPGIKITPINYDMKDDALIKLFDASNEAVLSSMGVPASLAAINTQGRLSAGSEKRNDYNIFIAGKTPAPRRILLERILLAKKLEGWDADVFYGFKDIEMATLDNEKSGKKEVANG